MEKLEEVRRTPESACAGSLPLSVIIAVRNEAHNLPRCLQALRDVGEVYVIDSQSADATVEIARSYGARVVQLDRKSTRLNSSHVAISYAVFCLKKKKTNLHIYDAGLVVIETIAL